MIDPENEDDVIESTCLDREDVELRTRTRLGLDQPKESSSVDPEPAFQPHRLNR